MPVVQELLNSNKLNNERKKTMYTIKQRILNELSNSDILTNDNNITLRYFQLYLEGNYNNEQEYYDNLDYIKLHKDNYKKNVNICY